MITVRVPTRAQEPEPSVGADPSPGASAPGARRARRLRAGLALLTALVIFSSLELLVRRWVESRPLYWDRAEQFVRGGPVDVMFLGTSRVAAAIDPEAFRQYAAEATGRELRVLNLGGGHHTLAMHYLGTRNFLESHPAGLRGTTVFIEAPIGLQEAIDWSQRWHIEGNPKLLVPLLRPRDIPGIWAQGAPFAEKVHLTVFTLTGPIRLLTYKERIGEGFVAIGTREVAERLARFDVSDRGAAAPVDLASAGGIQTDPALVAGIAQGAVAGFIAERGLPGNRRPIEDWDRRIVGDLVRLIQGAGGSVVFFDIPLHSAQATIRAPGVRAADRAAFAAAAGRWGTPIVAPEFRYEDRDFPDVFHLRLSRSAEFTRAVAAGWLRASAAENTAALARRGSDRVQ